jgi:hypothetical protein
MTDMNPHSKSQPQSPSQSPLASSRIPTLAREPWRCRHCGFLLGLEQGGELHVKYRDLQHWITGRCRHACRRCGAMNVLHTIHGSGSPCAASGQGGAR